MLLDDIVQGKHGDCFILASLISILHTYGSNFINKIIKYENNNTYNFIYYTDYKIKKISNFTYDNSSKILSPKSADWVKKIEYIYIKLFHKNILDLINNGGTSFDVFSRLIGIKPKIYMNRLFDNKEELYYDFCNNTIFNSTWEVKHFKYLDIIMKRKITLWMEILWKYLLNNENIQVNTIHIIKTPTTIGINSIFNKITIPGICTDHCYSIIGIKIDDSGNKYIHVCNPQNEVETRTTTYNKIYNLFYSNISIDRFGLWSLYEVSLFSSEIIYVPIISR